MREGPIGRSDWRAATGGTVPVHVESNRDCIAGLANGGVQLGLPPEITTGEEKCSGI